MRLILAAVFLYAGWVKLFSPLDFADSIASFQLLPTGIIMTVALALPFFEIVLGLLMLFKCTARIASLGMCLLIGLFISALFWAQIRGLKVDCGCFGSGAPSTTKTWIDLARDLFLGAMALTSYMMSARNTLRALI